MRTERELCNVRVWFDEPGPWVVCMHKGQRLPPDSYAARLSLLTSGGVTVFVEHTEVTDRDFFDAIVEDEWIARFFITRPDAYHFGANFWADMSEWI